MSNGVLHPFESDLWMLLMTEKESRRKMEIHLTIKFNIMINNIPCCSLLDEYFGFSGGKIKNHKTFVA